MTKVLVVGGTNFIGPEVVRGLAERGADVTVLHRGLHEDELGEVRHIHADRADVGLHLAGVQAEVVVDMAPIHERHAREVVDAAVASAARRVVAISSLDTYRAYDVIHGRDPRLQPIPVHEDAETRVRRYPHRGDLSEDDPMYDYEKLDVEDTVLGASAIEGVVLRLPVVFGPKDRQHRLFPIVRRIADGMPVIVMTAGLAAWRFGKAFRSNVADAIVAATLDASARNRIYNVGSFDGTEAEWARCVGEVMGWDGEVVTVDDDAAPDHLQPGIDVRQHLVADTTRIRTELGWSERVDLDAAIAQTAEWELANPPDDFSYDRDAELAAAGR